MHKHRKTIFLLHLYGILRYAEQLAEEDYAIIWSAIFRSIRYRVATALFLRTGVYLSEEYTTPRPYASDTDEEVFENAEK